MDMGVDQARQQHTAAPVDLPGTGGVGGGGTDDRAVDDDRARLRHPLAVEDPHLGEHGPARGRAAAGG